MPAVKLSIRCECGMVNTRQAMPPVPRVGEGERCFCGRCGGITNGEILERIPDAELQAGLFTNGMKPPAPKEILVS
jgi:hypothetical protein